MLEYEPKYRFHACAVTVNLTKSSREFPVPKRAGGVVPRSIVHKQ